MNDIDFIYYERKTFYKNVPNATIFSFFLGMESGVKGPQYIKIGFEINILNEQTHDSCTFDIMDVTESYCKIGEFYAEVRMIFNNGANNYNGAFKRLLILIKIILDSLILNQS